MFFTPGDTGADAKKDEITGEEITGKVVDYDGHQLNSYTNNKSNSVFISGTLTIGYMLMNRFHISLKMPMS